MSATEIIEQIKRLDPEERRKVNEFLRDEQTSTDAVQYIPRQALERSADNIFTKYDSLFRKLAQ